MKIIKVETKEQFYNLKKGDLIIVEWQSNGEPITCHKMHSINHIEEVILDVKKNTYFSIENYLNGVSIAKEVYLVKGESHE